MSEDDLMDEIDLFVEIDGLRAELAAARAEVGRLTEKVNRARDAADHWYHVSADLQTELEEARKSRDHWMEVAGSQLAACQKLQAERGPAEAAPPRPRPIRESLAEIAYQAEREAWYELTGNRSSPWHQVGDEVREVMRRVVDAVAAALDGTSPRPRPSRPELVGAILLAVSPYVKPGASPEVLGEAIAAALEEADRNAEACLRAQEEARRENDRLRDQIARLNALRGRRAPRVVEGIAVDVRGTTHAFGSADDFRTFVADHGNWVRAQWSDLVVWHPAGDDDTPLATGTGRPAVAGWYWGRWHKDEKADIVHIGEGGPTGPGFWEPFEWAGPLPAAPWEGRDE